MDESLKEYVESRILPRYEGYDAAHRRDHIEGVIARSLALAKHYEVEEDMVYAVAAYHDLGVVEGREFHHISSGRMLVEDRELRRWFGEEQMEVMREAIEDHRASSDHQPRSIYGMIVAEADREIVPEVVMRRTIQYGLSHYPTLSHEEQWLRFVAHLREKYDYGGYLKLYIPHSENAERLEELRRIIAQPERLREEFERLYEGLQQGECFLSNV